MFIAALTHFLNSFYLDYLDLHYKDFNDSMILASDFSPIPFISLISSLVLFFNSLILSIPASFNFLVRASLSSNLTRSPVDFVEGYPDELIASNKLFTVSKSDHKVLVIDDILTHMNQID